MTSKVFTLGTIVTSAGQINQTQDVDISPEIETILEYGDGVVDPQFTAAMFMAPVVRFATTAIARALSAAGISGLAITSQGAPLDLYMQRAQQGGTRMTGANSLKWTVTDGIIVPRTLTVTDRQVARISYEVLAVSPDGTTAPLAFSRNQTMPSINDLDQIFTVGPVKINGTLIEGIKSQTWDFGLQVRVEGSDGECFPTLVYIEQRAPVFTFTTTAVDLVQDLGGFYGAQSATDSEFYLRRKAEGGCNVASGTSQHIKASLDEGMFVARSASGEGSTPSEIEVIYNVTWDGVNDPIALDLTAAIS